MNNQRKIIIMKSPVELKGNVCKDDILVWRENGKKDLIELIANVNWMGIGSMIIEDETIYLLTQWWEDYLPDKGKFKEQECYAKNPLKNEVPFIIQGDSRYGLLKEELEKAERFYNEAMKLNKDVSRF